MSECKTAKRFQEALAPNELRHVADEDIDYSEIPPADEEFWRNAKLVRPGNCDLDVQVSVDPEVVSYFRPQEAGFAMRVAAALEDYVRARRGAEAGG